MRSLAAAVCVALCACGSSTAPQSRLTLALENGTEIRAISGRRTDVVLIVLGAGGRDVALSLDAAPGFVTLEGFTLVIAPARTEVPPGPYGISITARAGDASDTKSIVVVVERTNVAPELRTAPWVTDARGSAFWGVYPPWPGCLDHLHVWGSLFEPGAEQDAARIEVELARDGEPFTGAATWRSDWLQRRLPVLPQDGGSFLDYSLDVPGTALGVPYRVAVRAVDEFGDGTEWWTSPGAITCTPFAPAATPRGMMPGTLCTRLQVFVFDVEGTLPGPAVIEAVGLPSWATTTVEATSITITVAADPGAPRYSTYPFELRVTSGGYTATARYAFEIC